MSEEAKKLSEELALLGLIDALERLIDDLDSAPETSPEKLLSTRLRSALDSYYGNKTP